MYETILLPTDGSAPADAAVEHAIDLAAQYGATLHALYVVDVEAIAAAGIDTGRILDGFEAEGRRLVEDVAERAEAASVTVETAVVEGSPHRSIREYAEEHDVDLVVMGTHGRRGIERYLLGSVTERVVRTADVPVMSVHAAEE